jgi:hypothetical protein
LIAGSLGKYLHPAIGIIAHPTGDPQDVRLALDKPAETYTLDASPHYKAASLNWFFAGGHLSEMKIAELRSPNAELNCILLSHSYLP